MYNKFNRQIILFLFILIFLSLSITSNSQKLYYSAKLAYNNFTVDKLRSSFFKEKTSHDHGFDMGFLLNYEMKNQISVLSSGIIAGQLIVDKSDKYNYLCLPVYIDFMIGNRMGGFVGTGVKVRYFPFINNSSNTYNEFLISIPGQLGYFVKFEKSTLKIYLQIEGFQSGIYSKDSKNPSEVFYKYYYNLVSFNLSITIFESLKHD